MRTLLPIVASVALFLLAAKIHGRQLRLEREAHGVLHVVFGGQNPPQVEALWRAERIRFALVVAAAAVSAALGLRALGASPLLIALSVLLWAPSLTFLGLGAASELRTGGAAVGLQSLGWWTAAAAGCAALVTVLRITGALPALRISQGHGAQSGEKSGKRAFPRADAEAGCLI
jgi:hypothetical protein